MLTQTLRLVVLVIVGLLAIACIATEKIPPCTPLSGSSLDPCASSLQPVIGTHAGLVDMTDGPSTVQQRLIRYPSGTAHLVVRGLYLPETIRCTDDGNIVRLPSYYETDSRWFYRSLAAVKCYADLQVREYIVGTGPAVLTVEVARDLYGAHEHNTANAPSIDNFLQTLRDGGTFYDIEVRDGGIAGREMVMSLIPAWDVRAEAWMMWAKWDVQRLEDGTIAAIHPHISLWKGWPDTNFPKYQEILEMPLNTLVQEAKRVHAAHVAAHDGRIGADTKLPKLVTHANQLRQYYTTVGAYSYDTSPVQPPPVPLACDRAVPDAANNPDLLADCKALAAFQDGLGDAGTLDWSSSTPIGRWEGVTVGGTPKRVLALDMEEKGLTGTLPAELGQLTGLTRLNLEYNDLRGEVPATLGNLTGLVSLSLSGNRLTGAIPSALGGLTRLTTLDLAGNDLAGAPPTELGNLRAVTYLSLGGNALTGPVPAWVSGLPNLQELYLDGNAFTGTIPAALGGLSKLQVLALGRNQITGAIPPRLGNLKGLEELALHRNQLTGAIPVELLGLPDLEYLYLSGNRLTGCVPVGLLDVSTNDLDRLNLPVCPNQAPVFARASYAFSVAANAAMGTAVGTVTATDADAGDAVAYAITAGNGGGEFAISEGTGVITVAKALREGASYTLTVTAADRNRGAATVTVSIAASGTG